MHYISWKAVMTNNWLHIWQSRQIEAPSLPTLALLLALDGFDGFGGIEESAWLAYADRIANELLIQPGDTIFEVGCGAGAFLYAWHMRGHHVGGIDYAANMVKIARQVLPGADISENEATHLDPAPHFDVVMAQSVFFYFPDLDHAAVVLEKMIRKAYHAIAILDVPDLARKDQSLAFRRGQLGADDYTFKYAGLDHLYFDREWFKKVLRGMDLEIRTKDQNIPGYGHNPYRFNVFINKCDAGCVARRPV